MTAIAHLDHCICRWPTERAREWLSDFLLRARRDSNILAVVAIGSAMRMGVASDDLDILVVCRDVRGLDERAPFEVDLRAFDYADIHRKIADKHDLLAWAILFGRPLFDRQQGWVRIVKRWRHCVPLPDPVVARARASIAQKRMNEMRDMGDEDAAIELEVAYRTHCARAELAEAGVYPASRPELPDQLRTVGAIGLADQFSAALEARMRLREGVSE